MKKYKVTWSELKHIYHEAEVEAEGLNQAARQVLTAPILGPGDKTVIDVVELEPEVA